MCDIRLFKSALLDYKAAKTIYNAPYNDEMFLNNAAYHLQQCVEKTVKGALECVGVTVHNTHRIVKLLEMVSNNGANLTVTEWVDNHAEMLSSWEAETRYNMDFVVEKRKLDVAMEKIAEFLESNGIKEELRPELRDKRVREKLFACIPQDWQNCSDFELNCYYLMFAKKVKGTHP